MGIVQGAIGSFLIAFPALFSIVNPPGGALIYHQVTADRGHAERVRLAWRVALYAAAVMLVALWAGASLIGFFGVTLAALRIAGGLVVAARAWELLSAPQQQEDRKQAQAAPAAGGTTSPSSRSPCRSRRVRAPSRWRSRPAPTGRPARSTSCRTSPGARWRPRPSP